MIERITLLGSSSGRNAGDAALIAAIMDSVDEHLGRKIIYEIPTINPAYIRDQYHNDTVPVGMMPWHASVKMLGIPTWRSIMRSDLVLIFDAILFDRSLYNPLFNFMSTVYLMLPRAKKKGKKMAFMNVGAGPVNTPMGKKMLLELSEIMDFMTARDKASFDIINDLGVKNPRLIQTADSAVDLKASGDDRVLPIFEKHGLDPNQDMLGVNVNRYIDTWADKSKDNMSTDHFVDVYAKSLDTVQEKLKVPVVFVATQHHDVQISQAIIDKMQKKEKTVLISNVDNNHYDIKGVMGKLQLLFGMRLHANILASSALTPIVGLNYQPKVKFYFDDLGLPEFALPFDDFSEATVTELLLRGWEKRDHIQQVLNTNIPVLQQKADSAGQLVAAIDKGEDLDAIYARWKTDG
jgi:polysaccharide pyruvyl transferase WcaK-like protein